MFLLFLDPPRSGEEKWVLTPGPNSGPYIPSRTPGTDILYLHNDLHACSFRLHLVSD